MALTKEKKQTIIEEVSQLLSDSKLTVIAKYQGTPVKALQTLRKEARDGGTTVKVVKNRLVIKALSSSENLKDIDTAPLNGMLLYAFNDTDDVAPAQVISNFAKTQPTLEFVGGISEGLFISADDVKTLANLPGKEQLRGQLVGIFAAPLSGFVGVLSGNVRGVLNVLNARVEALGN